MQTVPWPKQVFCLIFREDQSLLHRSRNSGREYVDVQTPLWVSTSTSYLLYKVQDPFSAYRQSHVQNRFFCLFFREDQSLLHRPRNSGRECAWWTNSLVGQYLHQLSLVQSSRSIQRMQTVPRPKQVFCLFFREDQSLLHRSRNSGREYVDGQTPLWISTYTSYLLYKVQDPFSACRQSHVQNRFSVYFLGRTSLCYTDQHTEEENILME